MNTRKTSVKRNLLHILMVWMVSMISLQAKEITMTTTNNPEYELATFGGGCFWCAEAIFQQVRGVESVVSGYAGGSIKNPSYREVTTGRTGHAEVIQISFDPEMVSYLELLEIFFSTHDPTTLNRQGADIGTQYRSIILYHSGEQFEQASEIISDLDKSGVWKTPIVTQIEKYSEFYPAEKYHQDYYKNNPNQGYCRVVIQPKLEKFRKVFSEKLK